MTNPVQIRDLGFRYPDQTVALENVDLDILKGESVVILGPNGAGKTTLLLHINGIFTPQQGSVKILGKNLKNADLATIRKRVGLLFQDPDDQLFMPTVFDDVAFGPLNLGCSKREVTKRVAKALEAVDLPGYGSKCPHHLSYGEKRKVSLATILSMNPEILVLDEPTANLDPASRLELIGLVRKLNQEGKTVITATHDVNTACEIADTIYILNRTIVVFGDRGEIFSNPSKLRANGLEPPAVTRLFEKLKELGLFPDEELPSTMEEAVERLIAMIYTSTNPIK